MKRIKRIIGKFVLLCVCMMIPCMMDSSQESKAASYSLAELSPGRLILVGDSVGDRYTTIYIKPGAMVLALPNAQIQTYNYSIPHDVFRLYGQSQNVHPLDDVVFKGYKVLSVDTTNNTVTVEPYFDDNPSASGFGGCEITISTDTSGYTYDGTTKRPSVSARQSSKVLYENTDYTLHYYNNTNAGTNTASVVVIGQGDYSGGIRTLGFSIAPKTVSLSWSTTTSFVYDGNEHCPTATATGLIGEDTCNVTVIGGQTNASNSTYTATASSLSDPNYKLPSEKTKSFTITQRELGLTWGSSSFTYDGQSHCPSATATGLINGDSCSVTVSGSQTNASDSTYTATASSLSNSNYKLPSAKTKSFTISKRPLTITAAAQTVICDGTIDTGTNKVSAPNLVSGHRVTSITLTPSDVSAPTTTGTITPSSAVIKDAGENTVTSNYNITYANGTLTVINCTHTSLTAHPEEQPTLTSIGHVAYWTCDDCGKKFSDSLGANEINTVPALYKVVYSANGGSGTMADSVAQIGDRLTLPACGFSAPANKQFDHWEVSGLDQICAPAEEINVASNICVGSVITVTAKWRDAAAPYTPPTYSTPTYDTTASTPILPGGGGWDTLSTVIESIPSGGSLEINMNGTTTLPAVAIDAIKDKDVNLVLDMGNGIKWTVNGKNITNAAGDINMGVYLGASGIPVDVINRLTGQRERVNLMLANAGGPGFMATLTVPLRKEWTGLFANLFNYNRITKNMDFVSCGQINPDGNADLIIGGKKPPVKTAALGKQNSAVSLKLAEDDETSQASSTYTIVVDDHSLDPTITAEPTPSPSVEDATKIKLTASSKGGQVILSWNKIKNAKKYRVYQSVGGKNKLFREFKKTTLIVKKAFAKGKNKEMLKIGKKYKFSVTAYVNGKWTKITKASTKTIKVK